MSKEVVNHYVDVVVTWKSLATQNDLVRLKKIETVIHQVIQQGVTEYRLFLNNDAAHNKKKIRSKGLLDRSDISPIAFFNGVDGVGCHLEYWATTGCSES